MVTETPTLADKARGLALGVHGALMASLWWALRGHLDELGGGRVVFALVILANAGYVLAGALLGFGASRWRRAVRNYLVAITLGAFVASWAGARGVLPASTIVCAASFLVLTWGSPGRVRTIVGWLAVAASTLVVGTGGIVRLGRAPLHGPPVAFELMRVDDDFDPFGPSFAPADGFSVETETIGEAKHRYLRFTAPHAMSAVEARRYATEWVKTHVAIPPGIRIAWKTEDDPSDVVLDGYWLREPPFIGSADVSNAIVYDRDGPMELIVSFREEGAARFRTVTRENVGKRLAVLFDGAVMMAPVVRAEIPGGQFTIKLGDDYDRKKAEGLAAGLRGELLHGP